MTIQQAIAALKSAGFTNARFGNGRVIFEHGGKIYTVRTDFRAEVKSTDIDAIVKIAKEA